MTPTTLAAALIKDVPRYVQVNGSLQPTDGQHGLMRADEVLAALTAALDGVEERAGEVQELAFRLSLHSDLRSMQASYYLSALLAQNAALRAERDALTGQLEDALFDGGLRLGRAEAAEATAEDRLLELGQTVARAEAAERELRELKEKINAP